MEGVLLRHLRTTSGWAGRLMIPNFYYGDFEADLFGVDSSRFAYEWEIKTSRADYKNDFKKASRRGNKHDQFAKAFESGKLPTAYEHWRGGGGSKPWWVPNYFYFVCPPGIIRLDELPNHAGLIYIAGGKVEFQRRCKRLHPNQVPDRIIKKAAVSLSCRFVK